MAGAASEATTWLAPLWSSLHQPFTDPASRTFWVGLLLSVGIAGLFGGLSLSRALSLATHRSSLLDAQLLVARQLLGAVGLLPAFGGGWWLATGLVRWLDGAVGAPDLGGWSPAAVAALYTAALFVVWDLSRYALHRLMHEVPALWAIHQVHHSAEVLTPLTFHRVHPLESVLYGVRGALVGGVSAGLFYWAFRDAATVWTLAGVHAVGLVLNVTFGNLRHSHVWLRFGPLERWLISPAQHQLHHALDGDRRNYGTWLAVWDRLGGSLVLAGSVPPPRFGLSAPNHRHDLLSAWFHPLVPAGRALLPRRLWAVIVSLLLLPNASAAEEPAEEPAEESEDVAPRRAAYDVIVEAEGGKPRVAGSAHVLSEEELEQYEYDDIHAVLAQVPGVYVRGEDGYGLRPNIGIRGANADRSAKITLLEDGVLMAPAPYSAPAAYFFPMSTRMVAVEVFKGPAAIQHGPHTVGGALNLVTRSTPQAPAAAVDLGLGLRRTAKVHAWTGAGGERWGMLAEGVFLRTDGFKHLDGGGPTGFDQGEVMLKTRVGTDPARRLHQALELKLGYAHQRSNESYLGLGIEDYRVDPYRRYAASALDLMRWDRTQVEVAWPLHVGEVDLRTVAYHHGMSRAWTKFNQFAGGPDLHDVLQQPAAGQSAVLLAILAGEEDSASPDQTLMIGTNDRRFGAMGVQTRARWSRYGDRVNHRLEGGLRLHADHIDRLHDEVPYQMRAGDLLRDGPAQITADSRAEALALAAHVLEDLDISGFHVIPGVRAEVIRTSRSDADEAPVVRGIVLPGLGLLAEVAPGLDVFVGAHRGFSPVAPGEPAEVGPEISWNVEAGLRAGSPTGAHAEAVGFLNDYTNITGQCSISGGCSGEDLDRQFNGGRALVHGLESSAGHELLLPHHLSVPVEVAYTWTRSSFRTGFVSEFPQFGAVEAGDALPYVPEHQGSARVSLEHPRARVGAALNARSGMLDVAGPLPVPDDTGVPPLITLDLQADGQLTRALSVYATATNVTNASPILSWRPFGARPPAPFQLMLGIKAASL
jgi:Fe(3+) dicitrate transport protein